MTQTVSILDISDGSIKVGCSFSCNGCHAETFCRNKDTSFTVTNPQKFDIKKGDRVVVESPEGKSIFTILLCLFFPLMLFLPSFLISSIFIKNEIICALLGLLAILVGFLLSYLFFRNKKDKYSPFIVSVIKNED